MKWKILLGCFSIGAARVLAQTGPVATESLPALEHIDVTLVDTSVSPCNNFYQYACGKLNESSPIPPDQIAWGAAGKLQQWNRLVLKQILEKAEAPDPSRTPNQQKIGDFYASCMDDAAIERAGLKDVDPLLTRIAAIQNKRQIASVLAEIHRSFGTAWEQGDNQTDVAVFGYGPTADFNDINRVVAGLDQGGLAMPGRDFYLKDDAESKAIREKYAAHIVTVLKLGGASEASAREDADKILAFETQLAKAQMDNITRRDPVKLNNRFTLEQVRALAPSFAWDDYLTAVGAPTVPLYEVTTPGFFREIERLIREEDVAVWKAYLHWQMLDKAAPYLGANWREASFDFYSRTLLGAKEQPPQWRRCTTAVDRYLGQALGQVYVEQVFPPETKARAQKLVKDIEAAMGRDIDTVTWMQAPTKQAAHLKLAAVLDKIGYPDQWIDYSALEVTRDSYVGNVQRATVFEFHRQLGFIGKPLDRMQWGMTPPTVDAYEDPQTNTINFPAGILQPIFFDASLDDVINYGSEGAVVGHELTHNFDDQGRKFDAKGNLRDWWTAEDTKKYEERGACIAEEYTGPVPGVPGLKQDGRLTQGEDTADNGGMYLALSALNEDLKGAGKTLDDKDANGLTNLQRFFLAYGNSWCETLRPEAVRTLVLSNPHSLPELRVNNVVSNMPEFQKAFGCKAGQPMVHAMQCRVW